MKMVEVIGVMVEVEELKAMEEQARMEWKDMDDEERYAWDYDYEDYEYHVMHAMLWSED